jgi:hypothetical protein
MSGDPWVLIVSGAVVALITYALPPLIERIFNRRVDASEAEKIDAETDLLKKQSDRETIKELTDQLHEAQESIRHYRKRLRAHGVDPDSDTGPLSETKKSGFNK